MGVGPSVPAPKIDRQDMFAIAFFGMCYYHKGLHNLIRTFHQLKSKYPKLYLLILSSQPKQDQYYFQYCKKLAEGIPDITWHDQYIENDKIVQLLGLSDLIVLPYEDYGGVGTSAAVRLCLRAQRPLIVSNTCWFSDLDPFVAPRIETFGGLSQAIEAHLQDYNFESWIQAIQQHVKDYQWKTVVDDYIHVYRTVLSR
jgi:glycosyltransferase involved in cell wall biosynthesis